jgi:hypothetical protein
MAARRISCTFGGRSSLVCSTVTTAPGGHRVIEGRLLAGAEEGAQLVPDQPAGGHGEGARRAAAARGDAAVGADVQDEIGKGLHEAAQFGVGLQQLVRADLHRRLDEVAIDVRLEVTPVDGLEKRRPRRCREIDAVEIPSQLPLEECVHGRLSPPTTW